MQNTEQQTGSVRLEMPINEFEVVSRALEFHARLGIGRFERIEEMCRQACLSREDFPFKALKFVEQRVTALKALLLDMGQGQSHGIHGTHVAPAFAQSWQWTKAMKNRHAWDFYKDGRQGVWHQDPGQVAGFAVSSQGEGADWRCIVEIDAVHLPQLHKALEPLKQAYLGQYRFLLDWARDGMLREAGGKIPSSELIRDCLPIVGYLQEAVAGLGELDGSAEVRRILQSIIARTTPQEHHGDGQAHVENSSTGPLGLCDEVILEDRPRG